MGDLPAAPAGAASSSAPPPPGDAPVRADGELQPWELMHRLGLLAAAAFFLAKGTGSPLDRSPVFLAAALALSCLATVTLAVQWRVLGDWRRRTQGIVLLAMAMVLVIPVTAALNPSLGESALPQTVETAIVEVLNALRRIPGVGIAVELVHGVMVFCVTLLMMIVLVAHSGTARRGGIFFVAAMIAGLTLFFHPSAETVAGLALLALFLRTQWEPALLLPAKLRGHLKPAQIEFLRDLVREGGLSTGETKLLLDGDAASFAQLVDFGLAEFDTVSRQVVPGKRLLHDPAAAALEAALGWARRGLWVAAGAIYFLLPDLIPGPIDDLLVMAICAGAGFDWVGALFGRKRP